MAATADWQNRSDSSSFINTELKFGVVVDESLTIYTLIVKSTNNT